MQTIQWSNARGSRRRAGWLLLIRGDEVMPFTGVDIPGVVVVRGTDYKKNGDWSYTTYRLVLSDGIRHIAGMDGWETGRFVEGLGAAVGSSTPDTWAETALALGVSVPSAMEFLRSWRPNAAEKLDEVEESLAKLEEASETVTDSEKVVVSFGSPSNRAIREGYWESPKGIPGYNAEIRLREPVQGWIEGNIEIVGIAGTVLSVKHAAGMHGGYYAVSLAVVPGTETEIPPFETTREKAAKESGLPPDLHLAFDGDTERVKTFMEKVARLDVSKLDEHEMSCGRARQQAEVIRVSGDHDFYCGADPLEVGWFIWKGNGGQEPSSDPAPFQQDGEARSDYESPMAAALRKAGLS